MEGQPPTVQTVDELEQVLADQATPIVLAQKNESTFTYGATLLPQWCAANSSSHVVSEGKGNRIFDEIVGRVQIREDLKLAKSKKERQEDDDAEELEATGLGRALADMCKKPDQPLPQNSQEETYELLMFARLIGFTITADQLEGSLLNE